MYYEIVINQASGSGILTDEANQRRLEDIFTAAGHRVSLQVLPPEALEEAIAAALRSEADGLIIGGGDGSITSTAALVAKSRKVMGVLPLGTFNLEARDLGIPLDPFEAAHDLAHGSVESIDLLRIDGQPCLCSAIIGFYPAMSRLRKEIHGSAWWMKTLRIPWEMLTLATRTPVLDISLQDENKRGIRRSTRATAFSPGKYVDTAGLIPRRTSLSTGKFCAYISEHLTRRQLIKLSKDYLAGSLFSTDDMTLFQGKEITLDARGHRKIPAMIDGEEATLTLPCKIEIDTEALSVLTPDS